eukprot:PITA_04078
MIEEYQAIIDNNTWKLVDCPSNLKPIGCKWVYRIKYNQKGELEKYKARLVAKGFAQQEGIDYEETFSPTTKWNTIRLTLALATQMDVKSTFLNGDLHEEVYMTQPPGFEIEGQEHKVCKLIKALYGLKQAPRAWYVKMDDYFKKVGFQRSESDDTLYVRQQGKYLVILVMYVDDLIITCNHDDHIAQVKKELHAGYLMNMGSAPVSWSCKKQATMATSLAEAEYISAWEAACEIVWLRRILQDLGIAQAEATSLFIDNQSAIKLAKNTIFIQRQSMWIPSIIISDLSFPKMSSSQFIVLPKIKSLTFSQNHLEK